MTIALSRSWESLSIGEQASVERAVTTKDIAAFAEVSGDHNPLHIVDRVVHGMFLGALVSALIGMQLPGERALLVRESLSFRKPVKAGDTVTVSGTITHKSDATKLIDLAITITVAGAEVATGEVQVQYRI